MGSGQIRNRDFSMAMRCACAECRHLHQKWPDDGWQIVMFNDLPNVVESTHGAGRDQNDDEHF